MICRNASASSRFCRRVELEMRRALAQRQFVVGQHVARRERRVALVHVADHPLVERLADTSDEIAGYGDGLGGQAASRRSFWSYPSALSRTSATARAAHLGHLHTGHLPAQTNDRPDPTVRRAVSSLTGSKDPHTAKI